jgi:predicted PurR-regulated permease PerM
LQESRSVPSAGGVGENGEEPPKHRFELDLPVRTIVRVLVAALVVWAALKLWPQLLLILISVLVAVTLSPAIAWLERRGMSRGLSVLLIGFAFFALLGSGLALTLPKLSQQLGYLMSNLPDYQRRVQRLLPPGHPLLTRIVDQVFQLPASPELASLAGKPLVWGRIAIEAVTGFLILVVLSLYFLLDGKQLYAWLLAYVPRRHRRKMAATAPEVEQVIYAYMLGQLVTSLICTLYSFVVLTALDVPAAVPLALLAGVCDVLPVVGIVISTVPAVFLAITVSPAAAVGVLGAYLAYHAIETYLLVPRIYGKRLRLSTLTVLIAIIVGGTLQGVIGAILILPIVAAYPVIERIWLRDYLGDDTVKDHHELARAAENGEGSAAADKVMRGDRTGTLPRASASSG